jgi:hypothetical protein
MILSLQSFSESRKINKEEALAFIKDCKFLNIKTSAYLTGFQILEKELSEDEIQTISDEHLKKHKKALKFAKKKGLDAPELEDLKINKNVFELISEPYARNHKEEFLPQLESLVELMEFYSNKSEGVKSLVIEPLLELYNTDKAIDANVFFSHWINVLNTYQSLRDIKSDSEWFISVFEDNLTLGASMNGKYKIDNNYKENFLSKIKLTLEI